MRFLLGTVQALEENLFGPTGTNIDPTLGENEEQEKQEEPQEQGPEQNPDLFQGSENSDVLIEDVDGENVTGNETVENPDTIGDTGEKTEKSENSEESQKPADNTGKEDVVVEPYVEPEVRIEVTSSNSSIYKGYLYANATSEMKYATDYNTIDVVYITGAKNATGLTIQDEPDKMQLITNDKIGLMSQMYYRKTRISVNEFTNIFGLDGYIIVYSPEGEVLGYINRDTEIKNDEYVFTYSSQYNSVRFEFINMLNDGIISIKNDKSIKESSDFSRNQISLFSSINTIVAANLYIGNEVKVASGEGNINLEETESRMEIDIDTDTLSVEDTNNVAINITLRTDEERYDLFENPTIDIEFPSAIENVDVTGMTLLYKNGLSIENWEVVTNYVGRKVLKINLAGSQLEYTPGAIQEGTTIVAYTNLDVNRLTADTSENLKMTFTNKDTVRKSYSLEGKDSEDISLNFVGRQELVRAIKIANEDGAVATSYDNEVKRIQITPNKKQKVTITSAAVNNFETTITDVVIVGRIPFIGNRDGNGNDLGTNFDSFLEGPIATSGVIGDVYYSTDGTAGATSETWTQDVENFSTIKSYKIVIRDKVLARGEGIHFEYNLVIPESVGYNARGYAAYTAQYKIDNQIYTNDCFIGIYTEEKEIEIEDIKEDEKEKIAELTIGTQVSQCGRVLNEEDTVYERQILKYTVIVKNTSDVVANNVVLKCNAENANLYYFYISELVNYVDEEVSMIGSYEEAVGEFAKEYEEIEVGSLQPGESKTFEYEVIVKNLNEIEQPEVYGKIIVLMDNQEVKTVETIKNIIKDSKIELRINYGGTEGIDERYEFSNTLSSFVVYLKNNSDEELKDVVVTINLPEEITYNDIDKSSKNYQMEVQESNNGTNLIMTFPNISKEYEERITIPTRIGEIDTSIFSKKVIITGNAKVDEEIYNSNEYLVDIHQSRATYEYSWTAVASKEVLENEDNIIYTFKIKNTSGIDIDYCSIEENIPAGLEIENVILITNEREDENKSYNDEKAKFSTEFPINAGKEVELKIYTKVNSGLFDRDQETIENKLIVNGGQSFERFETNVITYAIKNKNVTKQEGWPEPEPTPAKTSTKEETPEKTTPATKPEETKTVTPSQTKKTTYYISGTAWIDSNQDGIRQASEPLREAVVVTLYKANSNGGIDSSNSCGTTSTDKQGKYTFNDVEAGNYIIVFDYNSSNYKVTKYQVENAKTTENSDAISKKITINGESSIVGVTDVISVSNASINSIDIGLVDKTNFDLRLEKGISEVVVRNSSGMKTYNFKDKDTARLEIRSKYYKSSVLDITYNFKVTNEGDVAGFVNKIVDYLPNDVEVVLNASPGWYIGEDGGLYYTGLVDKEIEAGESREFQLVVRKSLANGEAVKLTNSAEIVEYTNKLGLYDKDSVENNKMETEDDFSKALLVVSISTGNAKQVIATILIIIIMIAVITMVIIKLKNTKKIYK